MRSNKRVHATLDITMLFEGLITCHVKHVDDRAQHNQLRYSM